jgi:hypothetical protein
MPCRGSGCNANTCEDKQNTCTPQCIHSAATKQCDKKNILTPHKYGECVKFESQNIRDRCNSKDDDDVKVHYGITAGLESLLPPPHRARVYRIPNRGGSKRKSKIRRSKKSKKSRRTRSKK